METVKIYLCGGMSALDIKEQKKWRKQIMDAVKYNHDCSKKPIFFDPTQYYGFEETRHLTEREVLEFDLNALRNSDLVIVNFNDPNSIGTCSELAIAYENRIPVVGINKDNKELHPWQSEFVTRMCKDIREAVEYTVEFFLN